MMALPKPVAFFARRSGAHQQGPIANVYRWPLGATASLSALAMVCLIWLPTQTAGATDVKAVQVELNKLEPNGNACRAYLVVQNSTDRAFETLKLDLVMFGGDGIVAKRLAVETAPLPAGKTILKVFDIEKLPCGQVGRILLNNVMTCGNKSNALTDCLGLVVPSARDSVPFIK